MSTFAQQAHFGPGTPDVLVVGNICIDRFCGPPKPRDMLGGPSTFATELAVRAGAQAALVTAAPPSFAPLAGLVAEPNVQVSVKPCAAANLFELHTLKSGQRRERVLAQAPPLAPQDVPRAWRAVPVAYVAPVLGELGASVVEGLAAPWVAVGAQGWLRRLDAMGWMVEDERPEFIRPPANVRIMIFSADDHPEGEAQARRLAALGILTVLTRGADGGELYLPGGGVERYLPVAAAEVDATGAGDTFGCLFTLAMARGCTPRHSAGMAAAAAARVVEGPRMGTLGRIDWPRWSQPEVALG